jgi:hypothetical protein
MRCSPQPAAKPARRRFVLPIYNDEFCVPKTFDYGALTSCQSDSMKLMLSFHEPM